MKKFLATSGMVTYILLANAGVTSAQYTPDIPAEPTEVRQQYRNEKRFEEKMAVLASKAGIDPDEIGQLQGKRKTIKKILKENGVTGDELQQLLGNKRGRYSRR